MLLHANHRTELLHALDIQSEPGGNVSGTLHELAGGGVGDVQIEHPECP
jgi:hypothetical protein